MKINEKFWIQIFMLGFGILARMPKVRAIRRTVKNILDPMIIVVVL